MTQRFMQGRITLTVATIVFCLTAPLSLADSSLPKDVKSASAGKVSKSMKTIHTEHSATITPLMRLVQSRVMRIQDGTKAAHWKAFLKQLVVVIDAKYENNELTGAVPVEAFESVPVISGQRASHQQGAMVEPGLAP